MEYNKKCISSRFLKLTYPTENSPQFTVKVQPMKQQFSHFQPEDGSIGWAICPRVSATFVCNMSPSLNVLLTLGTTHCLLLYSNMHCISIDNMLPTAASRTVVCSRLIFKIKKGDKVSNWIHDQEIYVAFLFDAVRVHTYRSTCPFFLF